MDTTVATPTAPLNKRIVGIIKKAIEDALNWVFELTDMAAQTRGWVRLMVFLALWTFWTFQMVLTRYEDPRELLRPLAEAYDITELIIQFGVLAFRTLFAPEVWQHMLAIIAPYLLVEQMAAVYLADVFEKEVNVAQTFLSQAAFGEEYLVLRVREGKIMEEQYGSPILQIGGPGYIVVELDSAVLLERPDGSTRIIGPTMNHYSDSDVFHARLRQRGVIHGFERIRQCVDLRDVMGSQTVVSRSRDGIPVSAKDINFSYSVYRGENPQKTLQTPYPFDPAAIETMVYVSVTRTVGPGVPPFKKSDWMVSLPNPVMGNIIGGVSGYIGSNALSEFMSDIGAPEEEAWISREQSITQDSLVLSGMSSSSAVKIPFKAENVFGRVTQSQKIQEATNKILRNNGKQLNWMGPGTWETPKELVLTNYTEAWKQTIENKKIQREINIQREGMRYSELVTLLEDMPLTVYAQLYNKIERNQIEEQEAIEQLLDEYYKRLQNAEKLYQDKNLAVPEPLANAIAAIYRLKYHDVAEGYYLGLRIEKTPSPDPSVATLFTLRVGVFSGTVPGYITSSLNFDFGNSRELVFTFDLGANPVANIKLDGDSHRELNMHFNDFYNATQYELAMQPGTSCEIIVVCRQDGKVLGSQRHRLDA